MKRRFAFYHWPLALLTCALLLSVPTQVSFSARVTAPSVSTVPLYRLFDEYKGQHFYTTNAVEKNNAVKLLKFNDEGVAGYVFATQGAGTIPLYRLVKAGSSKHFYTTKLTERNKAIAS